MAEKANPILDELNKILTNTMDYKEVLVKLSRSVSHAATQEKLTEFAEVKQEESQNLMKLVKKLGGQVDTNERRTDQESVYWVNRPIPDANNIDDVLDTLIATEKKIADEYNDLLSRDEIPQENLETLKKNHQEAKANLQYFESAKATID